MVHLFIHFLVMLRQERKQVAFKKKVLVVRNLGIRKTYSISLDIFPNSEFELVHKNHTMQIISTGGSQKMRHSNEKVANIFP